MPVYDFTCKTCGAVEEINRRFDDLSLQYCTFCGSEMRKRFTPVAVSFKGGGFYRTDNR